jgi:hypothetical protein
MDTKALNACRLSGQISNGGALASSTVNPAAAASSSVGGVVSV